MNQFIEFCLAFIQDRISLCFWYWNLLVLFCVLLFFFKFIFKSYYLLIYFYFWLHWVFAAAPGLSLIVASGGLLLVAVHELLIAMASLVAEHRL